MNKTELKTVSQRLAIMFAGFPQSPVKDVDLQMEAYMTTLEREADRGEGFEFQDIIAAIERVMGGCEGLPLRAGCPNVDELCHECRERRKMRKLMEARSKGKVAVEEAIHKHWLRGDGKPPKPILDDAD